MSLLGFKLEFNGGGYPGRKCIHLGSCFAPSIQMHSNWTQLRKGFLPNVSNFVIIC